MKHFVVLGFAASLMLAACGTTTDSMPLAEEPVYPEALPRTEYDLRHLNAVHTDIVRRAERQCRLEGFNYSPGGEALVPCITRAVDQTVAASGDEALRAYHDVLPRGSRYDPRRSSYVWRNLIDEDES